MKERPIKEFEFIDRLRALCGETPENLALSDDVACISPVRGHDWVISLDAIQKGRHFRDGDDPELVARRLVGSSVSDLVAKGARPHGCLMAFGRDKSWDNQWLNLFAEAFAREIKHYNMALWGGDTVLGHGFAALTVHGLIPSGKIIRRSGAHIGDDVYVTGTIGDGYLSRIAREEQAIETVTHSMDAYACPRPPFAFSHHLIDIATASIDISDGLAADLDHICRNSSCGIEVFVDQIPLSSSGMAYAKRNGFDALIIGGDDYQTAFTAAPTNREMLAMAAQSTNTRLTRIGKVCLEGSECVFKSSDGSALHLEARGFEHF